MKPTYHRPTREPPPMVVPSWQKQNIQNQTNTQKSERRSTMKKDRKQQEDRLLKRLPLHERRRQLMMRKQITSDPLFLVV